ncbi:MAG: hypothetical protein ABI606_03375 [Rhodoferax sp.]
MSLATRLTVGFSSILLLLVTVAAKVALPAIRAAVQQGSNRETEAAVLTLVNQVRPEESRMRHKVEELVVLQRKLSDEANIAMAGLERKTQIAA